MGSRRKRNCEKINFSINALHLQDIKNLIFLNDDQALEIIGKIVSSDGPVQMCLIKEMEKQLLKSEAISNPEYNLVIDILGCMYYQIPIKSSMKRTFNSLLQNLAEKYPDRVVSSLSSGLRSLIQVLPTDLCIDDIQCSVAGITGLLDYLSIGKVVVSTNLCTVCVYLSDCLDALMTALRDEKRPHKSTCLYVLCQSTLKAVTLLLQQYETEFENVSHTKEQLLPTLKRIFDNVVILLMDGITLLNSRLNAGIAFPLLLKTICSNNFMSYLLSNTVPDDFVVTPRLDEFPYTSQLCIWNGVMAVVSVKDLFVEAKGINLADKILQEIITIPEKDKESETVLTCARTLFQWTNVMCQVLSSEDCTEEIRLKFSKDEAVQKMLLQYTLTNCEHFIDSLRYLTREIFKNTIILHLHSTQTDSKESIFLKELSISVLEMPWHRRGKYGILCCLAEHLGSAIMLELKPSLATDLYGATTEISLACHVSELCEVLYKKSSNEIEDRTFENIWLRPLIYVLCHGSKEQRTTINEHILPKLLAHSPNSMHFLISELSSLWAKKAENCFGALIMCAKFAQESGVYSNIPRNSVWTGCIPSVVLKKALCHADDQVRVSALSLLCGNPKTTEPVSPEEFELFKCILPFNINSQCPAFRQQLVSFIKKFLYRVKESWYALSKKNKKKETFDESCQTEDITHYKEFLKWLKQYFFSCLHPGANFPRRVTALNVISILHTLFADWKNSGEVEMIIDTPSSAQTLLEALKDTYENNKQIVLNILTDVPSSVLNFQDEKTIEELFDAAIILTSSTKPPDSVTAACVFSLLVQFDCTLGVAKKILEKLQKNDCRDFFVQPDEIDRQEITFVIIQILLVLLSKHLKVAEKSLLEAAAYNPVYGVLICIRHVVMQVKLNDVVEKNSIVLWQNLFHGLIALCFKAAAAVEPIVCNSSPEGHLPADTDKESIVQLQAAVQNAIGCRFHLAVIEGNEESESLSLESLKLDIVKTHAVTAQMLLLCSWRTHKEVSLLLGEIAEKVALVDPQCKSHPGFLTAKHMVDIGHFFTTQLSLVKHRGAFEQAYVGFCKLCHRLWRSNILELHELPQKWLQQLISVISGKEDTIQLCPTRRSAGVPFIMQALLVSEPDVTGSTCFKQAVSVLLDMAQPSSNQYSHDCQVHALNILRSLFRDACLGESVMPFVSEGLKVAILGFKAFSWAIRNSATIFFSALMTRIFGVNRSRDEPQRRNCLTGRVFFSRFPDLFEFLLDELRSCVDALRENEEKGRITLEPSLYPILLVLGRLYPLPVEGSDSSLKLTSFVPYLRHCAGNAVWKTRVLASKALVPLLCPEEFPRILEELFSSLPETFDSCCQNKIHGTLLQILCIIKELPHLPILHKGDIGINLPVWISLHLSLGLRCNPCFITRAVFMEIISHSASISSMLDETSMRTLLKDLNQEIKVLSSHPGKEQFLVLAVILILNYLLRMPLDRISSLSIAWNNTLSETSVISAENLIKSLLSSPLYEVRFVTLQYLIWLLDNSVDISSLNEFVFIKGIINHEFINGAQENKKLVKASLESMSEYLVCLATSIENHPGCLAKVYQLMCLIPGTVTCSWILPSISCPLTVEQKLEWILNQLAECNREDVANGMFLFSAHLSDNVYEKLHGVKNANEHSAKSDIDSYEAALEKWSAEVELFALPEQSLTRRQTVLLLLNRIKYTLLKDKYKILGSKMGALWQALLLLLTDDEPEIKHSASEIVLSLKTLSEEGSLIAASSPVVPILALDYLIGLFVQQFSQSLPSYCLSILLDWMLRCQADEEQIQGDEQPFDKGEMNVFAEDLTLTELASKHLSTFIQSQAHPEELIIFQCNLANLGGIHMFQKTSKHVNLDEVVLLCVEDVEKTIADFQYSPFLNRQFDKKLLKISQRIYVVSCLFNWTQNSTVQVVKTRTSNIIKSIKTTKCRSRFLDLILGHIEEFMI